MLFAIVSLKSTAFCGHEAELRPQALLLHLPDVHAVHEDAPGVHVVEARDEVHEGGLARARAADDRRHLPGLALKEMSADGRLLRAGVAEGDVAELDVARAPPPPSAASAASLMLGLDGQHLVDPARGGRGPGQHDEEEGHHEQGEEDLHGVLEERHEAADLHLARCRCASRRTR